MNIFYLINFAGKGGSEKYVLHLVDYLKDKENIFFIYNQEGDLSHEIAEQGILSRKIFMKNIFDISAAKEINLFCQENNIDIIHTNFPRENYLALLAKKINKKVKVIHTSHIILKNNFFWKILNKIMMQNNDAIISVCEKNKKILVENNYPADKISVIYNGVKFQEYFHNVKNSALRAELKLDDEIFLFTTLTRFTPEKGNMFLLESIKLLITLTDKKFKVLLVGDGEEDEVLKDFVVENNLEDYVLFLGYRQDVGNILEGSNCFVNSSQSEALSFAIIEAMSKALPVVATKVGGTPEIVNDETGCGILVRYGSTVQMARAMERFMIDDELYLNASKNSIKTVKEKFNIDIMLEKTYEMYKSIL